MDLSLILVGPLVVLYVELHVFRLEIKKLSLNLGFLNSIVFEGVFLHVLCL